MIRRATEYIKVIGPYRGMILRLRELCVLKSNHIYTVNKVCLNVSIQPYNILHPEYTLVPWVSGIVWLSRSGVGRLKVMGWLK